jgi:hypothetical protein
VTGVAAFFDRCRVAANVALLVACRLAQHR